MPEANATLWFQQPAHLVGMVCAAIMAYALLPGHGAPSSSVLHAFTHLLAFATLFGIQIWTTFVTGVVLIKTLPRQMFGTAQGALFPIYFRLGLFLSTVTLASFLVKHPIGTWTDQHFYQVAALSVVTLCLAINGFYASPQAIITMRLMYSMEDPASAAKVGNQVSAEVKEKPEYQAVRKDFVRLHAVSAIANLLALGCSVFHLYFLSGGLHF